MDNGVNRYFIYAVHAIELENLIKAMPAFMPQKVRDLFYNLKETISNLSVADIEKAKEHNEKAYQVIKTLVGKEADQLTPIDEFKEILLYEFMLETIRESANTAK
jgi:hypothetical protein